MNIFYNLYKNNVTFFATTKVNNLTKDQIKTKKKEREKSCISKKIASIKQSKLKKN